jgi:hypothetical protein
LQEGHFGFDDSVPDDRIVNPTYPFDGSSAPKPASCLPPGNGVFTDGSSSQMPWPVRFL